MEGARLLEEKCREFAVEGAVAQIHPGPVVTTFEFKPDAGVKYGKITGLADDLCLAMQAESVLIDRIPGKSTVGIQIPNHTREQISLRELLQSGDVPALDIQTDDRPGKDDSRRALHDRSHRNAAPANRGIDRHRKVGRDQRDALEHPVSRVTGGSAAGDDRSQARRAWSVRRHSAPDDTGGRRSEAGGKRASMGRQGDGGALQEARCGRRAQYRTVQPQRRAHGEGPEPAKESSSCHCRTSSSSSTSWPI